MQRPAKPRTPVRFWPQPPPLAQVAKQVDARDLKSLGGNTMPVRFRPWAPYMQFMTARSIAASGSSRVNLSIISTK